MSTRKPPAAIRSDIEAREQPRGDETVILIKDPVTEAFFEFNLDTWRIAGLFDGRRSAEEVALAFNQEQDAHLSGQEVDDLAAYLESEGLLQSGLTGDEIALLQKRQEKKRRNIFSRLFFIKLRGFNPDRILNFLCPRLGFFFTPAFVFIALVSITMGAGVALANHGRFLAGIVSLFNLGSLALVWVTMAVVVLMHEFAHGLTLKHYGGSVKAIGFLLIYFQPAFFCDVSDAYLLDSRRKKIWVTLSGSFFQLFIWSLATFLWRITRPELLLNKVFFIVMLLSGLQTLFNFNPLIKLDGYYILVDLLGVTNLRKETFAYLGARARSWLAGEPPPFVTARKAKIFVRYGVFAVSYTVLIIGFLCFRAMDLVWEHAGPWGLLVFFAAILSAARSALSSVARAIWAALFGYKGKGPSRALRLLLLLVLCTAVAHFVHVELRITSECRFTPARRAVIRSEIDGVVASIHVKQGDQVAKDAAIFTLVSRDHRYELDKIDAERDQVRARLDMARKGPRAEEIEAHRTKLSKARTEQRFAQDEFQRIAALFQENLVSEREREDAHRKAALADEEVRVMESELRELQAGSRDEEIDELQAALRGLEAQRSHALEQLELTVIASPMDGVVATPRVDERVGETLEKGDELCTVIDYTSMLVELYIPEREASDVRVGQKVKIKPRGLPETTLVASVESIATEAGAEGNPSGTLVAYATIPNPGLAIRPGLTGKGKVYCGERSLLEIIIRRVLRYIRVEFLF